MERYNFSHSSTSVYLADSFNRLETIASKESTVLLTDGNVYNLHLDKFAGWKSIVIKPGESSKQQSCVNEVVDQLIQFETDRSWWIVGIGGGVVTDIAGFVGSIYMRGVKFGFVPTTLLAMIDASLGGKNGIDVGLYKNLLGTINQPSFILYDHQFLSTLPKAELINGMAEIIKHACIADVAMFESLDMHNFDSIITSGVLLNGLISRNVKLKMSVVQNDELESGERKLLNFGHTLGHAIETLSHISHGKAISIGMAIAAKLSMKFTGLTEKEYERIIGLLIKYQLPVTTNVETSKILELVKMDKKRRSGTIDMIMLTSIGNARIYNLSLDDLNIALL